MPSIEVFEDGVPPRWRLKSLHNQPLKIGDVELAIVRADGTHQKFTFLSRGDYLESVEEIPEPHAFVATVRVSHGDHAHTATLRFHEHDHSHEGEVGLDVGSANSKDALERAHAAEMQRRFSNKHVTTNQIVMFGLTGGLIPCPASITVLLLCLQLKQFTLGATSVLCFSIGLAVTMVSVGAAAALSVRHMSNRLSGCGELARRAPYLSAVLIIGVGLYTGYLGSAALAAHNS
jgi:nickel/cobalt exporter